jgi:hypothetical protein
MDLVLDRLNAKRVRQGRYMAECPNPAHNDRSPSLSISHGSGGRTLVYCFGGCHLEDILRAAGLAKSDLFDGPPPTREQLAAAEERRAGLEAIRRGHAVADREYFTALRLGYAERASALKRVSAKVMAMADDDPSIEAMTLLLHDLIGEERSFERAIVNDPHDYLPIEKPVPRRSL